MELSHNVGIWLATTAYLLNNSSKFALQIPKTKMFPLEVEINFAKDPSSSITNDSHRCANYSSSNSRMIVTALLSPSEGAVLLESLSRKKIHLHIAINTFVPRYSFRLYFIFGSQELGDSPANLISFKSDLGFSDFRYVSRMTLRYFFACLQCLTTQMCLSQQERL